MDKMLQGTLKIMSQKDVFFLLKKAKIFNYLMKYLQVFYFLNILIEKQRYEKGISNEKNVGCFCSTSD